MNRLFPKKVRKHKSVQREVESAKTYYTANGGKNMCEAEKGLDKFKNL